MRRENLLSLVVVLLLTTVSAYGQSGDTVSMSLYECLDYAKENSITLQKARINISDNQASELNAKGNLLPTVAGSIGQSAVVYPFENGSSSTASYSGSYGVDLSLNLYNGGKYKALVEQSSLSVDIANMALEELDNSLEVAITEVYIEILYAIEQIGVEETSLALSTKNLERGAAFLAAGSINNVDYAQLESDKASSEYDLILSRTTLSNLYVELKHLLEISQEMILTVKVPELTSSLLIEEIPSVGEVYNSALTFRPEIAASELAIQTAELEKTIARAGYLPSLKFSAGTGINHSSSSSYTFSSQMRNNFNTSAGLTLSIPIFSNYANRTNTIKAENSVKSATLTLTETQKDLYQTIETLRNNAENAQALFLVATTKLTATEKSMILTNQQYELGMKNIVELLTEQDNFSQASGEYLTNKYKLIYNKALLNYYMYNIIKL